MTGNLKQENHRRVWKVDKVKETSSKFLIKDQVYLPSEKTSCDERLRESSLDE